MKFGGTIRYKEHYKMSSFYHALSLYKSIITVFFLHVSPLCMGPRPPRIGPQPHVSALPSVGADMWGLGSIHGDLRQIRWAIHEKPCDNIYLYIYSRAIHTFMTPHLDHFNVVLKRCGTVIISRVQCVQNSTGRCPVCTKTRKDINSLH